MRWRLFIMLITSTFFALTQTERKIDSLRLVLKTTQPDTTLCNTLIELGNLYKNTNFDSTLYYHDKARIFAEKINDPIKKGEAIKLIGDDYYYLKNDDVKAMSLYEEALQISEKVIGQTLNKNFTAKAKQLQIRCLGTIGVVYYNRGFYAKALNYYSHALKISEDINHKPFQAANIGNIGSIYLYQGDYATSLAYYLKALKIHEETGDKKNQAGNLGNIGGVYGYQGRYALALGYYFKALKINEEINDKKNVATSLGNIGLIYSYQGEYAKAMEYYFKSIKINKENGQKRSQASNLGNIAAVYAYQGDHEKALEYFFMALKIDEDLGNESPRSRAARYRKTL